MDVIVYSLGGDSCVLQFDGTCVVADVALEIERNLSIPRREQCFLFSGGRLRESDAVPYDSCVATELVLIRRDPQQCALLQELSESTYETVTAILSKLSDELRDDGEIFLDALQRYPSRARQILGFAADELKADHQFMSMASDINISCLADASEQLKQDRQLILALARKNGRVLHYVADFIRDDRQVILASVQQQGRALSYASDRLKADRGCVLSAMQQNWEAFEDAAPELKSDSTLSSIYRIWKNIFTAAAFPEEAILNSVSASELDELQRLFCRPRSRAVIPGPLSFTFECYNKVVRWERVTYKKHPLVDVLGSGCVNACSEWVEVRRETITYD